MSQCCAPTCVHVGGKGHSACTITSAISTIMALLVGLAFLIPCVYGCATECTDAFVVRYCPYLPWFALGSSLLSSSLCQSCHTHVPRPKALCVLCHPPTQHIYHVPTACMSGQGSIGATQLLVCSHCVSAGCGGGAVCPHCRLLRKGPCGSRELGGPRYCHGASSADDGHSPSWNDDRAGVAAYPPADWPAIQYRRATRPGAFFSCPVPLSPIV